MQSAPQQQDSPEASPPTEKPGDWSTYKRLLSYVTPYWFILLISILGFLAAAAAETYFGYLFGELINQWDDAAVRAAATIPIFMFLTALVRAAGTIIGETFISRASFNVVYNLRQSLFSQLLVLPSTYFDKNSLGHIVSRLTFTVAQLRDTGTDALRAIIQDGVKVLALLGAMLWLNWQLTGLFLATVPVLALVVVITSSRFRRISRRIQNSMGDVTHVVSESVSGYRVVRIFGGQDYESKRFEKFIRTNRQQSLKMVITKVSSAQFNETTISLAISILILLLYDANMSSGDAVKFMAWAGLLGRPIRRLSEVNAKLQRGLAAAEDVFTQLDETVEQGQGTKKLEHVQGNLAFENVSFAYTDGKPVLNGINLVVPAGQTLALVGRSGSGKTTLASLIPRFYDVSGGRILLDGHDICDYDMDSLRQQVALVSQQVTLFNDTLRNNIAYGALADAAEEDILKAVKNAHAHEFIDNLPDGLDTIVGDDGVLLSGGQRQRIAIARALLKDAPLLILDEATSALDNESERHIQQALEAVMRGRTTLVIAHRLSTVESADQIVVMDDGNIVESGDHAKLLQMEGIYADLYNNQFEDSPADMPVKRRRKAVPAKVARRQDKPRKKPALGLTAAWYEGAGWLHMLRPLSWVYNLVRKRRHKQYTSGAKAPARTNLPVIVVGNITVGGTGKTPLVGWLVEQLRLRGFVPGVVMRGYGGKLSKTGTLVPSGADPERYSDEAVQLRDRLGCAVAISANRIKGVRLLQAQGCDVAISDDGLQHYAMARDLEIAVVDGTRGFGNGLLLPAGPLREPIARLSEVDWVVANGERVELPMRDNRSVETLAGKMPGHQQTVMIMQPVEFHNVVTHETMSCEQFVKIHTDVHAVCGIGNPQRFFSTLEDLQISAEQHAFPDHYEFAVEDVTFTDGKPVICTEKDAAKLKHLELQSLSIWYLRVAVVLPEVAQQRLDQLLTSRAIRPAGSVAESAELDATA
ncbi:MAG: lipid A export permease/ATP-binding protein MsbA [Pseudomonadota bacterium]